MTNRSDRLRQACGRSICSPAADFLDSCSTDREYYDGAQSDWLMWGAAHREEAVARDIFAKAYDLYAKLFPKNALGKQELIAELQGFFLHRLKAYWREQGLRHDHITAIFAVSGDTPLAILYQRVKALDGFMARPDAVGINLLTAYRRASNIVAIEEKKDKVSYDSPVDPKLLSEPAELKLHKALTANLDMINQSLMKLNFEQAMGYIADLRPSIDEFFETVTVNTSEPLLRKNRLRLLSLIRNTLQQVADFSKIE